MTYITSRGPWYQVSWKGHQDKSGGIATNIGVHFFDLLLWLFGSVNGLKVYYSDESRMSGFIELEHARVKWYLSVDTQDLPFQPKLAGKPPTAPSQWMVRKSSSLKDLRICIPVYMMKRLQAMGLGLQRRALPLN